MAIFKQTIGRGLGGFLFNLIIFVSCRNTSNPDFVLKEVDECLKASNILINNATQTTLAELEEKLIDPPSSYKAGIWYPKARAYQELTKKIIDKIDSVKQTIEDKGS